MWLYCVKCRFCLSFVSHMEFIIIGNFVSKDQVVITICQSMFKYVFSSHKTLQLWQYQLCVSQKTKRLSLFSILGGLRLLSSSLQAFKRNWNNSTQLKTYRVFKQQQTQWQLGQDNMQSCYWWINANVKYLSAVFTYHDIHVFVFFRSICNSVLSPLM